MDKYIRGRFMAQGESITISPLGVRRSFKGLKTRGKQLDGVKRSTIKEWSKASVRRLRDELFGYHLKGEEYLLGFTGTLPGNVPYEFWKGYGDEFRKLISRFRHSFSYRFPKSYLVYRVELQRRGAPHIHAIVHFHKDDLLSDIGFKPSAVTPSAVGMAAFDIKRLWLDSVDLDSMPDRRAIDDWRFKQYGAKTEAVNRDGMMRYLCDHSSKRKLVQLGWKGRQWGVFQRENRVRYAEMTLPSEVMASPRLVAQFIRMVRRLQRYRQLCDCPFGSRLVGGLRETGVIFLGEGAVAGLKRWVSAALATTPSAHPQS